MASVTNWTEYLTEYLLAIYRLSLIVSYCVLIVGHWRPSKSMKYGNMVNVCSEHFNSLSDAQAGVVSKHLQNFQYIS